ncbi:alanine--tRNA ligase [bacterium]|nr:alanine--tRNA ligase [bacterium]
MKGDDIRRRFLDYFKSKGHTILLSSSLVPSHDPTLLFTNAGMVQFKDVFTGQAERPYSRAATCQKCMRAGGKHNDLENVGRTARHHTFFEMLGNFSFGDYFKEEAIQMGWEFLTKEVGLPKEKLWVTVFHEDEEAARIWQKQTGILSSRIVKMGEKDNFWSMGDTGPCGPCSEIVIDQGPELSCGNPGCKVGCDCDRYLEIWNLVFMQYERHGDGKITPLPKPSIDTGMGLERVAAVLQGGKSNYETDLFMPIIKAIEKNTGQRYGHDHKTNVSFQVISDHIRAITFLLADGVLPSNEGRGYVLRRIIRRAARHGKLIHIERPFLCELITTVSGVMKAAYPEIEEHIAYISTITGQEEERFQYALDRGLGMLYEMTGSAKKRGETMISGKEIFRLYDTYGFPLDLTQEILSEQGLGFDQNGFENAMENQKEQARKHWQGSGEKEVKEIYRQLASELPATKFLGYDESEGSSIVMAIISGQERIDEAREGQEVEVILDQTPFYAEKGGQIGDKGVIKGGNMTGDVINTLSHADITLHKVRINRGTIRSGDQVYVKVNKERLEAISLNHTATHLLHSALRDVLGDHVRQAGSLVAEDRLRFDFTHFSPLAQKEIRRVEEIVNDQIRADTPVSKKEMALKEAIAMGAMALFGEKYQDRVRVIQISNFSTELCGGTHCQSTGQIGMFIILSESGIAAGVRRIEAITGKAAFSYVQGLRKKIAAIADMLKTSEAELEGRIEGIIGQVRDLEKNIKGLKTRMAQSDIGPILDQAKEIGGIRLLTHRLSAPDMDMDGLRNMADMLSERLGSGVIVLAADINGKANLLVKISKDLTKRVSAVDLIRRIAVHVGGSGGGRPDMAQAGGNRPDGIDKALRSAFETVSGMIEANK